MKTDNTKWKDVEIEHLFGNHKFWENTKKKFNITEGPLLGSILKKRDMILVNLSDISKFKY